MFSFSFCTSSMADSQFSVRISEASLPQVALATLSLSVDWRMLASCSKDCNVQHPTV